MLTASVIAEDARQRDGRRWITERHTDHLGQIYEFRYLADMSADAVAFMTTRIAVLNAALTANEIGANVASILANGALATYTLDYSTAAQNFAALRNVYASATQLQAVMLGDFLASLTSAQLQAAFNLTAAQVTALRSSKLTPAATAAATIRATAGA